MRLRDPVTSPMRAGSIRLIPPARARGTNFAMGVCLTVLGACSASRSDNPKKEAQASAPVRIGFVTRRDMAVVERSLGTVVADTFVQVVPRVGGLLERQTFREGQFVRAGALLFEIDPRPYRAAVAQALGVYRKDLALLQNARIDQKRFETLYKQDSTSRQSLDTAVTNTGVLAATVASDNAALDMTKLNLAYTKILSPIGGKTGPVLVQPGNVVSASSPAPLVTVAKMQPIKLSFTLPETDLPRLQARQRTGNLVVRLEGLRAGRVLQAPVGFVSNSVNAQSGTIELRASFPNDDLALVPGQLVQAVVVMNDLPNTLVVPRNAINDGPTGP